MASIPGRKASLGDADVSYGEWSEWGWLANRGCWFRARTRNDGTVEYGYGEASPSFNPKPTGGSLIQTGSFVSPPSTVDGEDPSPLGAARRPRYMSTSACMTSPLGLQPKALDPESLHGPDHEKGFQNSDIVSNFQSLATTFARDPSLSSGAPINSPYRPRPHEICSEQGFLRHPYSSPPRGSESENPNIGQPNAWSSIGPPSFESLNIRQGATWKSDWKSDKDQNDSRSGYMSIWNPKGFFKLGRIFKIALLDSQDETLVVVGERSDSAISCSPIRRTGGGEGFPIIIENPNVSIEPSLQINFVRQVKINPNSKVSNVGRIDRNHLKRLKELSQKEWGGYQQKQPTDKEWIGYDAGQEDSFEAENAEPTQKECGGYQQKQPTYKGWIGYDAGQEDSFEAESAELSDRSEELYATEVSGIAEASGTTEAFDVASEINEGENFGAALSSIKLPESPVKNIKATSPTSAVGRLFKEFRVHPSRTFKRGTIFKILWSEPRGLNKDSQDTGSEIVYRGDIKYGEEVYSSIRRFVIVREMSGHCVCVPILTYGGQGATKPGVKAEYHAIIYTGSAAPKGLEGEPIMGKRPIKVVLNNPREKFQIESRVNYSKVYTIEHNVKACFIGRIDKNHEARFFVDFQSTFE